MHTDGWSFTTGFVTLKPARQKKRLQKKDFDKQLIRIHLLQENLYLQKRALPLVPLDEPYQRGWKRSFVLGEDVARCNQAAFYRTLLTKINTVAYSSNKSFTKKKRHKRKKVYEVRPQQLRAFFPWEWDHPGLPLTEAEKVHFHREEYGYKGTKTIGIKFVYNEPWRFVLQTRPHMITHVRMVDEVLEQEIQQLDNYIDRNHLYPAIHHLLYGRHYNPRRGIEDERQRNPLKNKPLHKLLEAVPNDDL